MSSKSMRILSNIGHYMRHQGEVPRPGGEREPIISYPQRIQRVKGDCKALLSFPFIATSCTGWNVSHSDLEVSVRPVYVPSEMVVDRFLLGSST